MSVDRDAKGHMDFVLALYTSHVSHVHWADNVGLEPVMEECYIFNFLGTN